MKKLLNVINNKWIQRPLLFKATLAVWSLTVRKKREQTDWMSALKSKIEIVRCIDGAINGENVATGWL